MPRHKVHAFAVVRVPFDGIEARSHQEAIAHVERTKNLFDISAYLRRDAEYNEEVALWLVDEEGDEQFERSCFYAGEHSSIGTLRRLVDWYEKEEPDDSELERIVLAARNCAGRVCILQEQPGGA